MCGLCCLYYNCLSTLSDTRHTPDQLFPFPHEPAGARGNRINADLLSRHPVRAAHSSVHHVWEAWRRREYGERSSRRGQHGQGDHLHRQDAQCCSGTLVPEAVWRRRDHAGEEERRGRTGRVCDADESVAAGWRGLVFLWGLAVDQGPGPIVAEDCPEDYGNWQSDCPAAGWEMARH